MSWFAGMDQCHADLVWARGVRHEVRRLSAQIRACKSVFFAQPHRREA